MKFLFLFHGDARPRPPLPPEERKRIVEEHMAYTTMLRDLGVYVSGKRSTAEVIGRRPTRVRSRW